jgi:hypothetical protein
MISRADLRSLARERLRDARTLLTANRFDGAVYLSGYVVEIALKSRICQTLSWTDFPETRGEFADLQSFKTHNLDVLLRLSGVESRIKTRYLTEWSTLASWDAEARYRRVGTATRASAALLVDAAGVLLRVI